MSNMDTVHLIQDIEEKIKNVRTRTLDLSFNELLDMYKDGELIITPEYQRMFRWSFGARSRFIESLLLEMPIPPIFVIEKEDGVFELIDGLQRISSYLHFRGELVQPTPCINIESTDDVDEDDTDEMYDTDNLESPEIFLTLSDCDICPSLNGLTYKTLPKTLEIRLKRSFIRVEVLRKESDSRLRYHMFKRLNTGGAQLSPQEIRNCTIRLLDSKFNDFIIDCSNNPDYVSCISNISKEKKQAKYDQELVLRFFAFKNNFNAYVHDINGYLTDYMESVALGDFNFDYELERIIFNNTFAILSKTLKEKSFATVTKNGNFANKFAIYHYEAISLSIAKHVDMLYKNIENEDVLNKLNVILKNAKSEKDFTEMTTGGGKNYAGPLKKRLSFIESKVKVFTDELR